MAKPALGLVNSVSLRPCVDFLPALTGARRLSTSIPRRVASISEGRACLPEKKSEGSCPRTAAASLCNLSAAVSRGVERSRWLGGTRGVYSGVVGSDGSTDALGRWPGLSLGRADRGLSTISMQARAERREGDVGGESQVDVRRNSNAMTSGRPGRRGMMRGGDRSTALSTVPRSPLDMWGSPEASIRQMMDMVDRFDRLTDDALFSPSRVFGNMMRDNIRGATRVPMEFQEMDHAFLVRMDMPGISKDELSVQVEDGDTLIVSGEHKAEEGAGEGDTHRIRSAASYRTRILLPDNVKTDEIKAEFKDGVLHLVIPKKEAERKVVDVHIG
ncbi:hypothetical protein CBR_g49529 [Chara braunii]|uniref:SHSP domain-containing protein n=1 Tax=Chara braunii TaxID=69332 RepID=A0A388M554_CHABU|nr:hypothetical protein CBR_g49529 [Chara braunii]|eukprot:GBG89676.1 hypothetical protein CBR_g49529 [Chara braunii]